MKSMISHQAATLGKAYWQHGVLVLLALLIVLQLVSWGKTFLDLRRIDAMIADAKSAPAQTDAPPEASSPAPQTPGDPGSRPEDRKDKPDKKDGPDKPEGPSGEKAEAKDNRTPAKNIFKREQIPYQLTAIFMNTAVIDGQYVKVGDRVGKALVKEIASTHVSIQEDGKSESRKIELFQGGGESGPVMAGGPGPGGPGPRGGRPRPGLPGGPASISLPASSQKGGLGARPDFRGMTPEQRKQMFQGMSPEEQQRFREQRRNTRRVQSTGGPVKN